ncbi:MAG: hypothetical protein HY646_06270 [Acidobacteria bacterium]|nr:hypothetical protein [Acidobacteriota bacterium]
MDTTVSCSASALLDTWSAHDWTAGLQLENLDDMQQLTVQTENSTYEITTICSRTGDILIRGGRFFPEFTAARLAGSSLGGSFLKLRGIYAGFNLEIHFDRRSIITSRVRSIALAV